MTSAMPSVVAVADGAVLVVFGEEIDDGMLARIHALDAALAASPPVGMVEVVPALTTLLVVFDPLVTDHDAVTAAVLTNLGTDAARSPGASHVIDVGFGGVLSPDLAAVAQRSGLSETAVVNALLSGSYTVGMYGFAPGYAYLYGTPASIQLPRNPTPGPVRPAGSLIIAGQQCMIIPTPLSTGWFAIGQSATPVVTGDPDRPFLFNVGDTVTFHRVEQ